MMFVRVPGVCRGERPASFVCLVHILAMQGHFVCVSNQQCALRNVKKAHMIAPNTTPTSVYLVNDVCTCSRGM